MKKIRNFLKDRRGATAVTFGLMLVPILGMTGLAVDYTRASSDRSRLQNAADSAALAGASIYIGTNANEAEARARAYMRANLGADAENVTMSFSASNQRVNVGIRGETNSLFMQILNKDKVDIGVGAQALAPLKPTSATIKVGDVFGIWFKRVTIVAVKKNGTENIVGTVVYYPKDTKALNWRGTGTTVPPKDQIATITLSDYESVYLKMEVKKDGCDIGYAGTTKNNIISCKLDSKKTSFDATLRTDDEETVNHLFVDKKQLPLGSVPPLTDIFKCEGGVHDHAWEDGGGWPLQDFFYTVTSACKAVDGEHVRLTQ